MRFSSRADCSRLGVTSMILALPCVLVVMTPACRQQHVHLPRRGRRAHLLGQIEQVIGGVTHRRDHDDHVVALLLGFNDAFGDAADPLGVGDRGSTVLLYDERHCLTFLGRGSPKNKGSAHPIYSAGSVKMWSRVPPTSGCPRAARPPGGQGESRRPDSDARRPGYRSILTSPRGGVRGYSTETPCSRPMTSSQSSRPLAGPPPGATASRCASSSACVATRPTPRSPSCSNAATVTPGPRALWSWSAPTRARTSGPRGTPQSTPARRSRS